MNTILMKPEMTEELNYLISRHKASNYAEHKDFIVVLLKELARRLLLWIKAIEEKNGPLDIGSNILLDIAFQITGNKVEDPVINDLVLSHFDKLFLASYFNWKYHEQTIKELDYHLENPYMPFIELFKHGGYCLSYKYSQIEVYYGIRAVISPKEDFLNAAPFWSKNT
jgi:hypothetical protein